TDGDPVPSTMTRGPAGATLAAGEGPGAARGPDVPGFEILGELSRGGISVVYRARQARPSRVVALKMLVGGARSAPERPARCRTQAEAIARLQHPHIVQIFEVGEHAGLPYLVLEFIEGRTLARMLAEGPRPVEEAARLVETLARAVHHAHGRGIVH